MVSSIANVNSFICTPLNDFKYHYLTLIIPFTSFVYIQLNGSKHCYVIPIIQFNISDFFAHGQMIASIEND